MKKYSKEKLKAKRGIKVIIIILSIIAVACIAVLLFSLFSKKIVFERIDSSASNVSDDVASNSTPIIVNNLILGATYDKKWVANEKYYLNSKNGENTEVDAYSKDGKMGKYNIGKISKDTKTASIYTTISKQNLLNEYFAIASSDINAMPNPATKVNNIDESYIKDVKRSLGMYRIFNMSVKITEVYDIVLSDIEKGYIIFATNEVNKGKGAYSAIVYVSSTGKSKLIKYNYINNKDNAEEWPIYSLNFVADLNQDGTSEILLQETKEFEVKYDVIEYKNNNFYEIMSSVVK